MIFGLFVGAACGSASPDRVLPTAPTTVVPPPVAPPPAALPNPSGVNGWVTDTGFRPIAGAMVEVLDGPQAGMTNITNASGQFSLSGAFRVGTRVRAWKEGYLDGTSQLISPCATCVPRFVVNINLGLMVAPANIAGEYTMTVEACDALPREARTRSFTASIVPAADQPTAANTRFQGNIGGAQLVRGFAWEGIGIAVAGDYMEFSMGDYHGQPGLIERLDDDTYYSVDAWGTTTVGPGGTIIVSFLGDTAHCALWPGEAVLDANGRYTCERARPGTRTACAGGRLTLTKR